MAAVISIVITLLGIFALQRLPINRYPQITPPAVSVTAVYPGATAEDVALAVAAPIEQQLSGLDGLLYFQSANSSDGVMNLTVYFDISRAAGPRRRRRAERRQAGRAAVAGRGAPQRRRGVEGAERPPLRDGALLRATASSTRHT
ncbi:MAG: efflux RND transporter permease subunit [Gemmatimonadales bacterium]